VLNGPVGRLAVFAPAFGHGGVERMLVNLCGALSRRGVAIDLIVGRRESPYLADLPGEVRVLESGCASNLCFLRWVLDYLRDHGPVVLLSAKEPASRPLFWFGLFWFARRRALPVRVAFRCATTVSRQLEGRNLIKRWTFTRLVRALYVRADHVIAVSRGVAEDLAGITGLPRDRIAVAPNPVIGPHLSELAAADAPHEWLRSKTCPVVLGVGRLARAKDYGTLLRAFARVRVDRPCRLLVLGEGRQRARLEDQARRLGIAEDVSFPGFCANPYQYMARADLFVHPSRREGFANVLVEALSLGTPVVATDCPSGPSEILDGGRHGALVPVGDVAAMAAAMAATLDRRPDADALREAVAAYTVENSAERYAQILELGAPGSGE